MATHGPPNYCSLAAHPNDPFFFAKLRRLEISGTLYLYFLAEKNEKCLNLNVVCCCREMVSTQFFESLPNVHSMRPSSNSHVVVRDSTCIWYNQRLQVRRYIRKYYLFGRFTDISTRNSDQSNLFSYQHPTTAVRSIQHVCPTC